MIRWGCCPCGDGAREVLPPKHFRVPVPVPVSVPVRGSDPRGHASRPIARPQIGDGYGDGDGDGDAQVLRKAIRRRPMIRSFVSRFLLPLVKGGPLHIGRPLDHRAVDDLWVAFSREPDLQSERLAPAELLAASELSFLRTRASRAWLLDAPAAALDEETFRLGAALHNVLLLAHPALGDDPTDSTRQRIADSAQALAALGPPPTAISAVHRHSLLARVPEIVQPERVVSHWLGRHRYLGRTPPPRVLALPRLRRVRLDEVRHPWLRDVGVSPLARPAWQALLTANPLGEALDPLRLEPPLSFARALPVLRFAPLCRLLASRVLDLGLVPAGAAFAAAVFRYAALRESTTGAAAAPYGVALGITFLAHTLWLDLVVARGQPDADGAELGDLLVAAAEVDARLVFPPDVRPGSDAALKMQEALGRWRATSLLRGDARYRLALGVARHAALHLTGTPALPSA
jgi:hypothetical protein